MLNKIIVFLEILLHQTLTTLHWFCLSLLYLSAKATKINEMKTSSYSYNGTLQKQPFFPAGIGIVLAQPNMLIVAANMRILLNIAIPSFTD